MTGYRTCGIFRLRPPAISIKNSSALEKQTSVKDNQTALIQRDFYRNEENLIGTLADYG